jgi:molybdopterin synthase sulfur carrier subunit
MSIKIRYFASLKETLGRSDDEITTVDGLTVKDIWQQLNPNRMLPDQLLIAVNLEYANLSTQVFDKDEVAFFPPVTGG